MRTEWKVLIAIVTLVVALFVADYVVKCHGKPLTRVEAFQRASSRIQRFSLKYNIGNTPPRLAEESFDADQKTWTFTFHTDACDVFVIADRCEGTDIGGISGACNPR
jgi:hypothetical protein